MIDPLNMNVEGDEKTLPGQQIIYQWRHAWMRVISKAWNDEVYREKLLSGKKGCVIKAFADVGFSGQPSGSKKELDLWSMLEVEVTCAQGGEGYHFDPHASIDEYTNGWANSMEAIKPKLTLRLPPAPQREHQALAITDYMAAGMIYPITGCC